MTKISLLKEQSQKREESKSIDNVKRGEIEESKLNAGCNHALSSSDIMCSNAGAKKKAILTISPIKKPEMKRKPESGSLILFCEAPITDKRRVRVNGVQMQAHGAIACLI